MKNNYIALMFSFLEKKNADKLMDEFKKLSFKGGTICYGTGAATSLLWRLVGFEGPERAVLFNYVDSAMLSEYLKNEKNIQKNIRYACAIVPLNTNEVKEVLKQGGVMESDLNLIQIICNKGYSSEIVEKARSLGSSGATILQGRGTAREEDEKFFGSKLVREKEIILIVTSADKTEGIIKGVETLDCMKEEGSGIVTSLPALYFSKSV